MDLQSYTFEELEEKIKALGQPAFRCKQVFDWVHAKQVDSFDAMTNVPKALRDQLAADSPMVQLAVEDCQISALDGTRKYLFALEDGNMVEAVLMRYHHGNSVCISTQVGCRMGCRFCASTLDGRVRDLTAGEMLAEIYAIARHTGERVSNLVLMGTGEPLDNYDNVLKMLRILCDARGADFSQRNITLSTCGIVEKIDQLAAEDLQITLAISLHAPNQAKRLELMPVANKYDIKEVVAAAKRYFDATGRRITFEYSLVAGVNDRAEDARELASLLRGINCHVNLIPVNPIAERDYRATEAKAVEAFREKLEKYGINVTIRREMGRDIDGACGQLRKRHLAADQQQ